MPVMFVVGCAWASYARDASRRLRLGLLMPVMFVAGCAWASYACGAARRLRLGFLCL